MCGSLVDEFVKLDSPASCLPLTHNRGLNSSVGVLVHSNLVPPILPDSARVIRGQIDEATAS